MEQDEPRELLDLPSILDEPLIPAKQFCKEMGFCYSTAENEIKKGRLTPWIKFGAGKLNGQAPYEARIQKAARMANKTDDEIKEIVVSLVDARTERCNSLISHYKIAVKKMQRSNT